MMIRLITESYEVVKSGRKVQQRGFVYIKLDV